MRRQAKFALSNCMDEATASIRFREGWFSRTKSKDEERAQNGPPLRRWDRAADRHFRLVIDQRRGDRFARFFRHGNGARRKLPDFFDRILRRDCRSRGSARTFAPSAY